MTWEPTAEEKRAMEVIAPEEHECAKFIPGESECSVCGWQAEETSSERS